ncbi:MAG: transposase [Pseudomonadota bacterium]|nr:transposase [Gammaproteobacteria bacterium]MDQ3583913.1 transposase [Pseudomonadota bacterium]
MSIASASALNANLHFHCAVIDGVFGAQGEGVQFNAARLLCPADIAAVQRAARTRVLRLFARRGIRWRQPLLPAHLAAL